MNVATLRQEESYGSSWLACSLRMAAAAAPIFVPTRWHFHVWLRALGYVLPTGGVLLDSGLFVRKRAEARIGRGAIAVSCGLGRVRPSRATKKLGRSTTVSRYREFTGRTIEGEWITNMPTDASCSKCGSVKVVPRARLIDRGHFGADSGNIQVGAARRPQKLFKLQEKVDVFARVCGECGFTELFVDDAPSVYEAYLESQLNRQRPKP